MKKGFILIFAFMLMMVTSGCAHTFKGRVIDAGTREPIEGAAVVVYWHKETTVYIDTATVLKDVKETLTDENGEWKIRGPKGHEDSTFLTLITILPYVYYTREPNFIIFKPGYCSYPGGFGIAACRGLKPGGKGPIIEGATIELPRLTGREDRKRAKPGFVTGGTKWARKQKTFIKLLNKENRYLGVDEYRYDFLKEDNNDK